MRTRKTIALLATLVLAVCLIPGVALATGALTIGGPTLRDGGEQPLVVLERNFPGDRIYEGGAAEFTVSVGEIGGVEGQDWDLVVLAGQLFTFNDETGAFGNAFTDGVEYSFDRNAGTVTVDAKKSLDALKAWSGPAVVVIRARIVSHGTTELYGAPGTYESIDSIEVWDARYDFERKWDRSMLPGWGDWINGTANVRVENADYPWGQDFQYQVVNVETSDASAVSVEKKDDGWDLHANAYGDAELTVSYELPDEIADALGGKEGSYTFGIHVRSDVYEVDVQTVSGSDMVLPGKTVELVANGRHEFNEDSDDKDEELGYEWLIEEGDDLVESLDVDATDPSKATVTFRELREGESPRDFWEDARILVNLQDSFDETCAINTVDIHVAGEYTELVPTRNNYRLLPGNQETLKLQVLCYSYADGVNGQPINDAQFRWEDVDGSIVQVANEGDDEFTLTRLQNERTDFRAVAEWDEGGYASRRYRYEELNTNIWLTSDVDRVRDGGTLDLALDIDEALDPANVEYTVGLWDGEANEGNGAWAATFDKDDGWTVSADNKTVTLDGATLIAKDGVDNGTWIRVYAELTMAGEVVGRNDFRVEVLESGDINDCEFALVTKDGAGDDIYQAVDGSWALKFLQGPGDTFTPQVELRDGGRLLDPSAYTVKFVRQWWEGDERKSENVDAPLSVETQDVFAIVIEATGGGYVGSFTRDTAEIELVNALSLRTSYVDMYFEKANGQPFEGVVDDRINGMNPNYHVVPVGIAADYLSSLKVRTGGTFSYEENTHNGTLLAPGTDYSVTYYRADPALRTENPSPATMAIVGDPLPGMPTAPGTYVLVVKGEGNYDDGLGAGSEGVLVDLRAPLSDVAVARVPDQQWTGGAIEPTLQVTYNGQPLVEGVDYRVAYANNVDEGTATATISGCNPFLSWGFEFGADSPRVTWTPDGSDRFYNGSKAVQFKIVKPVYAYRWTANGKSVTATLACTNSQDFTVTETVATVGARTKAATCTQKGQTTYTATFTNPAFERQTKTLDDIAALGHSWKAPSYAWSGTSAVTAKRVCARDAAHVESERANTTAKTTKATLAKAGKTVYTAKFKNAAFKAQTKTVAIAKNNMTVKGSSKTFKVATVKKKAQTFVGVTVKNAKGTKSFSIEGGNAKSKNALTLNKKTGKVTVKKGTAKGTYSIKVKATSAATAKYAASAKAATVKVIVK